MATERIALVIGNGTYVHTSSLDHVGSDMAVMADTLRSLEFDVEALNDLDRPSMLEQIEAFGHRIDQAGKETIGLLFYAGHGFQLDGSNYLLPVDAEIAEAGDVKESTINLDLTLAEIAFATNDHKLVILDVPADQAIGGHVGASPGLAAIDAPVGTLVAFGALPGISDQLPPHQGLYPLALANAMAKPGLMVEQVFQEVRLNVVEATDGVQIPWESSSLISPVYLAGPPAINGEPPPEEGVGTEVPHFAGIDPRTVDLVFWTSIKDSDDPSDFADYLNSFPDGIFRNLAERRLEHLPGASAAARAADSEPLRIEPVDERLITQKRANVRAAPDSGGVIVATLEQNQPVEVTGEVVGRDWLQISLGAEIDAFIWKPLLGVEPPDDRQVGLAATLPPSKSALLGQWQGEYQCQWDTIGFTLDITDQHADAAYGIEAVFSFYPLPGTPSLPPGSFAMSGDYDPEDGTIVLKGSEWIERPLGLQRHDIAGRAEIGGEVISGRIETPGCSEFRLVRDGGQGQPTAQTISTQ
ncbi:MAG: caspase family protein [Pseudomonadota bacterium]